MSDTAQSPPQFVIVGNLSDVDSYVGYRTKSLREARGISVEVLAEQLGVSTPHLERCEQGHQALTAGMVFNLKNILSVDFADFFVALEDGPVERSTPTMSWFRDRGRKAVDLDNEPIGARRLLDAYAKLTTLAQKQKVIELVEIMAAG